MASAILVESVATVFGATRTEVSDFLEEAAATLGSLKGSLTRKIDQAMANAGSNRDKVARLADVARAEMSQNKEIRLLLSSAGFVWGALNVYAGATTLGNVATVAVVGLGVELAPLLVLLFGLVLMYYCGRSALGVYREIFGQMEEQIEKLSF